MQAVMKLRWQQLGALAWKWRWLWLPAVSALVLALLFRTVLAYGFDVKLRPNGIVADSLASILLAYWLYALLRPWWLFLALQTLVVGTLYVSNGFKIYFFEIPVRPTDFQDIPVLLDQTEGWRFLAMVTPLLLVAVVFLAGLRWRWRTLPILAGGVLLVAVPLWVAPKAVCHALDSRLGFLPFGDIKDFAWRGPLVYLYNEKARELASVTSAPDQAQVAAALGDEHLPGPLPPLAGVAKRDVYVFMMESFWDPSVLSAAHYDRDPLAPAFRKLWQQAGESKAMVPVFGHGTPNSEFEVLCGEPAYGGDVMVFMTVLDRPTMCLPRMLAQLGYHTTALTPDSYGTWNRGAALQHVGIQRFYTDRNFHPTDRNGQFMSNVQLFEQADELMADDRLPAPRFTFISTDSGHYPYEMDEAKRPTIVHSDASNEHVQLYANAVYYDSMELADYIARIRARDPDALIVAFGDHLPVLGSGLDIMVRSHLTTHREDKFTAPMFVVHQSTPLLVVDGPRGPVKLGPLSLYEVPRLLLSLLGASGPTELDAFAPPPGIHVRPYDGRLIVVSDDGSTQFCSPEHDAPVCGVANKWDADMRTLRDDVLAGHDFTDGFLYGPDPHHFDLPGSDVLPYTVSTKAGEPPGNR